MIARDLGLRPMSDRHLMWIAEKALHCPLPADWRALLSEDGRVQYLHE
jgi:hypothetical protein